MPTDLKSDKSHLRLAYDRDAAERRENWEIYVEQNARWYSRILGRTVITLPPRDTRWRPAVSAPPADWRFDP